MAKLTILEALQLSLNATKKYVDNKVPHYNEILITEISGDDYRFFRNNDYFNMSALNIDETKSYVGKDINITDDEEYTFKFVYNKESDALIDENSYVCIYNHKSYDGTNFTDDVNSAVITFGITPMVVTPEVEGYIRLYEVDKVELDNNCLPEDVNIKNSLTVGKRLGDIGMYSIAEGYRNTASGEYSHAEGDSTIASEYASHAEGAGTTASALASHAEGNYTTASGNSSHSEGNSTTASGVSSHTEGMSTTASGGVSHAEGRSSTASGMCSHAEGNWTIASSDYQHVQGKYNIEDTENKYTHIVGNGTSSSVRSNAHTLDWNGNAWYQGKLSQDGTPTEDKDLATKKYVDDKVAEANASGGYTHPDSHPASMITGLATVATSGSYNDLNDKPVIPSIDGLASESYVNNAVAGLIDSAPEALNTLNELATALGNDANFATTISNQIGLKANSADLATVATSGSYNDLSDKPTIPAAYTHPASHPASMITGLHTVATSGDYNDLNNKPSIPTVTNDLTNKLKANYDAAYTHSTSAHAPSNAQKNSDITKAEIEAKLIGDVTTHTHSQYLTSIPSEYITEQELTSKGYATESQINSAIEAAATTHEEVKTTVNQILGGAYIE